ncbi:MAG TPA: Sua5/YciO/YrdC/YwlC family protein [Saprospiraceae bacterium]|nr:Sua5/YciO/YrdC/YwlC family protein [Saprospiraceae bacterium]
MKTFHIHIQGIVQGVGYRPYIAKWAKSLGLKGCVSNGEDGVHLYFNSDDQEAKIIYSFLKDNTPVLAKIFHISLEDFESTEFIDFSITLSSNNGDYGFVSPDFAICTQCKKEMLDPNDRRYLYPFITCTTCGPRFSIIDHLPYDRENTIMSYFSMCALCKKEYHDIGNTRFYSQTNSCNDCGIKMHIYDHNGLIQDLNLQKVADLILDGKIIAVKGIGGYILICDATNDVAIKSLRVKKNRPFKPLAILFEDIEILNEYCQLCETEQMMLESEVAPILLLPLKNKHQLAIETIAPELSILGAMLPNNGLHLLLSKYVGKPLIATSANISGSPILFKNQEAF